MPDTSMTSFRCWSAESVARTVFSDIGALASDADAVFLAAHTPVELVHAKGIEDGIDGSGESQVLTALTSRMGDLERNTLVAVTGGSGSGKSHVVRWVHSHLDKANESFHVLYVPRAVQTLRDLLRRIIDGLPEVEGSELMDRVDAAISNVKPGELQERLINEIKIALNWSLEDQTPLDGESSDEAAAREDRNWMLGVKDEQSGGRQGGLAELIDIPQFKETLLRSDGRLNSLVQSYFNETSLRASDDEIFTPDDLPLKVASVRRQLRGNEDLTGLWNVIGRDPREALDLLEEALRIALPRTVGLRSTGGDTLDSLFRESRRAMRAKGQDLVLVFEDLAQFGLVDGELYDQFVTPPGDDLAPLRVVFAVTDGAYNKMERTVRTRVNHEFEVDGSALADSENFVGRYLNLVRVGRDNTQALWDAGVGDDESAAWMVNACDTREEGQPCRFKDRCHSAFGTVPIDGLGDVGLYPYTSHALTRSFTAAKERAGREGRPVTPRDIIQLSVEEVLQEADPNIQRGEYPHARTAEQFDFKVRGAKDALLNLYPSSDPERMYRALVIWGDESPLPPGVLEAFDLVPEGEAPPPDQVPTPSPEPTPTTSAPELENLLSPLFQWQNGDDLPENDVNTYRRLLVDLVQDRLGLDQHLIHIFRGRGEQILSEIFNITSFDIEGARGRVADTAKSVRFEIKRTQENVRVLAAARWFRDHGHFDPLRAKWQWPQGYDPAVLFVELETQLDEWASAVRERVLATTGGSRFAQQAIGLRALALAAAGVEATSLRTAAGILGTGLESSAKASSAWEEADAAARGVIAKLNVEEYVGEFAAVRQGSTGQPQLVDPYDLEVAISDFLDDPEPALRDAVSSREPVIAQSAKQLLDALSACVSNEAAAASEAFTIVHSLLENNSPQNVARHAGEVGETAKNEGFFRPQERLTEFRRAVEELHNCAQPDAQVPSGDDLGTVVREQRSIRELHRLRNALSFVQEAMVATKRESERTGTVAGDVSKLETSVKAKLKSLTELVNSLGSGGTK